jgi:hypothetical protein
MCVGASALEAEPWRFLWRTLLLPFRPQNSVRFFPLRPANLEPHSTQQIPPLPVHSNRELIGDLDVDLARFQLRPNQLGVEK